MPRCVDDGARRADLDDGAEIHHRDAMRDLPDQREVVRDEEVREPALVAEVEQQVEHLRLDRNVERGDRLVADDEVGLDGEARAMPAMPIRWRCPPENSCGYFAAYEPSRPTSSSSSVTRRGISRAGASR